MRTYDPPPYTAPHERIADKHKWEVERDAFEAALEAKYGIPYEKLPPALRQGAPKHPRAKTARRFNYRVYDRTWRIRSIIEARRSGRQLEGWRTERAAYLADVERVRRAEVEVRKQRAIKKGRGKPLPKNLVAQQRLAIENREFREKSW
jgi:hypothetical protein